MIQVHVIEWPLPATVVTAIAWRSLNREDDKMQVFDKYPRTQVTLPVVYTFRKLENGMMEPISLMDYATVTLLTKRTGAAYGTVAASFDGNKLFGKVLANVKFTAAGIWDLQFVATKGDGITKLFGEPLQVTVAKNIDELTTEEILEV